MILSIAQQSIIGIGMTILVASDSFIYLSAHYAILCGIIVCLIFFTILFCITNYIMKNKLNLE